MLLGISDRNNMFNVFIWFIEARCIVGKVKPTKKWFNIVTLHICYLHIFKNVHED